METSPSQPLALPPAGWGRAAFVTGLLAGTLDITAAGTQYVLMAHKSPVDVLYFVASGLFGKAAFAGGPAMAGAGLGAHYCFAVGFAVGFYWLCARLPVLVRHKVLAGVLCGALVWLIMNLIVVPSSQVAQRPFRLVSAAIGMGILMLCIGLPIAWRAAAYYSRPR